MAEEGEVDTETELDAPADEVDAQTEAQARALNWVPQDEWKGPADRWKPADEFIKFSQELNPVLRQNNKELLRKNAELSEQLRNISAKQVEQDKILRALETASVSDQESQLESKAESLRTRLKEANSEGDHEAVAAIQEELLDVKVEQRELKNKPKTDTTTPTGRAPELDPGFLEWKSANAWVDDPVLASAATAIGVQIIQEARAKGETPLTGRAHLDEVTKRMDNKFNVTGGRKVDKVGASGTNAGSGGGNSGGSEYSKLPSAAKKMCEGQSAKYVGSGKAYAKIGDWQAAFAKAYNED